MSEVVQMSVAGAVGRLKLNRPERHNALDEQLIHDLHRGLDLLVGNPAVRVIVLCSEGPSFCAGADLEWMKRAAQLDGQANFQDARQLASLLFALSTSPKPVVARVQGAAYGGGVGLISVCDIAVGVEGAQFALTEVRLGIAAATISPYVLAAMGMRQTRRLVLTGERFDAHRAKAYGLLHEVVAADQLDAELERVIALLLQGGPGAQAAVKDLIRDVEGEPPSRELTDETARRLAAIRASHEGREGIAAFLEKRKPNWVPQG
ncbi:enoyl-CoA hydratase/isomerase family protein [Niveibacterium sp. 24ML]|uniref:enoyl-CoA hydratase/isomerase family protein n=1 Tax=Niveibacterium sp. 24ML TaxID=2985512 RepID=UPI00227224D4|nr:enoyl-CoA hydratase/isomerase family protein [Niveibacterium sp. 24ML]MCX9157291.1 enoyl-CoA hydratase/isomerase family protein [Niveibacterium sp. 24ML]